MNFNVRYTSFTALSLAMFLASFSQPDSLRKKTIWLRPSVENGISFIRNEYLKNAFSTNSTYNWGFGVRFGNGAKNDLLPFVQYSNSKYTGRHIFSNNQRMDSVLRIREIIAGFVFPVKRFGTSMLRAKTGFIHSTILDEISNNDGDGMGVQLGIGFETKMEGNSRVYLDCSYDLIKYEIAPFRDYDILKLSIGIVL